MICLCAVSKRIVAYARGCIALRLKHVLNPSKRIGASLTEVALIMRCSASYCGKLKRWTEAVNEFPFLLRAEISIRDALENVAFIVECARRVNVKQE